MSRTIAIMGTSIVPRGAASDHAAATLRRLRKERRWTLEELSAEMEKVGRPKLRSVLNRIEQGQRRIDVDDLVAFAAVFGVRPVVFLDMPSALVESTSRQATLQREVDHLRGQLETQRAAIHEAAITLCSTLDVPLPAAYV